MQLVVIGDGAGASGVVESVTDFSSVVDPFGRETYFLNAESTFTLSTADFTVEFGFENSDNVTFLLVSDFTSALTDDLDTDDGGTIDSRPWGSVIDSAALQENTDGIPVDANQEWGYGSDPDVNAAVGPMFRDTSSRLVIQANGKSVTSAISLKTLLALPIHHRQPFLSRAPLACSYFHCSVTPSAAADSRLRNSAFEKRPAWFRQAGVSRFRPTQQKT